MLNELVTFLKGATLTLPALEVGLLLAVLTLCLVLRFTRIGLITAYLFTYRWGWILFAGESQKFFVAYLMFGGIVGILTVIGMLRPPSSEEQ